MNVVVIGSGPAGVMAAIRSAELGAQTALVTRGAFGGMAANDGPVPVRTLAYAARPQVGDERAQIAPEVEPQVAIEAPVLGGDHRLTDHAGDARERHPGPVDLTAVGDHREECGLEARRVCGVGGQCTPQTAEAPEATTLQVCVTKP